MSDLTLYLYQFLQLLLSLWWLWLAIFLYRPAKYFWLWERRESWESSIKFELLEIKIPEEVTKTPKAMENVLHSMWALYDPPANIRDYWIDGKHLIYFSLEIVGKKDEIHFYIRTPKTFRHVVENAIYGEYPDAEIQEVDDYVYNLGKALPNEKYDTWGTDMGNPMPSAYPIRTHEYWETEMTKEEKKIDPLAALFECFGNLKEEEEIWVQIKTLPITDQWHKYIEDGKDIVNKIMQRPEEKKTGILDPLHLSKIPGDIWNILVRGEEIPERQIEEKEERVDFGIMRLSPGETEIIKAIEDKLSKYVYEGNVRSLYISRRDIYLPARGAGSICGAFNQFSTNNLNGFKPDETKTKVAPWFFEARRLFLKKQKIFRFYSNRMWPWHRKPYIYSISEIATIFHFPGKTVSPAAAAPRVEFKKTKAPPVLPT